VRTLARRQAAGGILWREPPLRPGILEGLNQSTLDGVKSHHAAAYREAVDSATHNQKEYHATATAEP
jgi:hypothetical protein